MNSSKKQDIRDQKDAEMLVDLGVGTIKVAAVLMAGLKGGPTEAISATALSACVDVLSQQHKPRGVEFVYKTIRKVRNLPTAFQERFKTNVSQPEGERFFETAWRQAAETVEPEKIEAISSLVKNSLSSEEIQIFHAKKLLKLLSDLDEVDLILLQSYTTAKRQDSDFIKMHQHILNSEKPHYPYHSYDQTSTERELDIKKFHIAQEKQALHTSRINRLAELGMLGNNPNSRLRNQLSLTPLGTALLKIIDLAEDDEWGDGEQINTAQASFLALQGIRELQKSQSQELEKLKQERQRDNREIQQGFREIGRRMR